MRGRERDWSGSVWGVYGAYSVKIDLLQCQKSPTSMRTDVGYAVCGGCKGQSLGGCMGTDMGTDRWGIHLIVAFLWDTLTAHAHR